jgi:two-component system cell cycle response regulator
MVKDKAMNEHPYNLLVVDDELAVLKMVEVLLRDSPFRVVTATSGEEALHKANSHAVDIVLLDIMMPGISGVTVCGHLRANPKLNHVPIVMLTALDDYHTRRQAMQAGATDLMTKPVGREELIAKLNGVLAESQARSVDSWVG